MDKIQTLKGFRDFLPSEARKRQFVINILSGVFESYGFEPLETPALEYEEVLLGKYGQEGDKLMYSFEDAGKRRVALRYDQTVPLARVVAQYGSTGSPQVLPMPFKRYQIQPVWRAENTQKGRYREFLQCDIDTVGTTSPLSDAEIIACTLVAAKKLGFKNLKMNINDRKIFEGVDSKYLVSLDKLSKVGKEKVIEELSLRGMSWKEATDFISRFESTQPTETVKKIFSYLNLMGFEENRDFRFNPLIVRGLDYYTGAIFELVDSADSSLSLAGGGRFDNLIGIFAGKNIPAVGIAFGFDRVIEAMEAQNLFPPTLTKPETKILVCPLRQVSIEYSLSVADSLRRKGIATEIYLDPKNSLEKQLKYADNKGILRCVIIGENEMKEKSTIVKNMATGEQKTVGLEKILKEVV